MMNKLIVFLLTLIIFFNQKVYALTVGSDSAVSRQAYTLFPNSSTTNSILGFAAMDKGFTIQDRTTTCTFDSFIPVGLDVQLNGGTLFLRQDLFFERGATIGSVGHINGGVNRYGVFLRGNENGGSTPGGLSYVTQVTVPSGATINSVGWSFDNRFLAVGSNALDIYSFNGVALTFVTSVNFGVPCNSVRWHPRQNSIAVGMDAGSLTLDQFAVYSFNGTTLTRTGGALLVNPVLAVSWHPGGNFVVTAGPVGANELVLYSFNTGTGTVTNLQNQSFSPAETPYRNSMGFSSDGQYLCVGLSNLRIYFFNGATLTQTASAPSIGTVVYGTQWNPVYGDYIAVAQQTNPGVGLYSYTRTTSTLTLLSGINDDSGNGDGDWHPSGCFYLPVASTPSNLFGEVKLFSFDTVNKNNLTQLQGIELNDTFGHQAWTPNGRYAATGGSGAVATVWSFRGSGHMNFTDTTVSLDCYTKVGSPWLMNKNCRINGNGHTLDFGQVSSCGMQVGSIQARRGARLVFEDVVINNLQGNRINCLTSDAVITFSNCKIALSGTYTFSIGAMIFAGDVMVTGTNIFTYSSPNISTISSYSTLTFGQDTTFNYAPSVANKSLLRMAGRTAQLYLNGCSLTTSATGLNLNFGTLSLDNHVTISCGGLSTGASLEFGSALAINLLGDSLIDLYGPMKVF